MSVKKGVIEWREIADFPSWEINSQGAVRAKVDKRPAEKIVVGASYCYRLRFKGQDRIRAIRPLMRQAFPEVNFS